MSKYKIELKNPSNEEFVKWQLERINNIIVLNNVINTITPKIAKLVSTIDYSDHPLSRLDPVKVEKMYKDVNDIVKKYDFMKGMLGRTSFKVPLHKYVADTMRLNLWTPAGLERAAKELNIL